MKNNNQWSLRFTSSQLLLLPAALGINYIGKLIAEFLSLPLWLDSIGMFFACILGGPIIGALSGLLNNILFSALFDPVALPYALTSIAMGVTAGVLAFGGYASNKHNVLFTGVAVALVAAVISAPINVIMWEGANGNIWGDILFGRLKETGLPLWAASFLAELAVDLPDKIISVFLGYMLCKSLPKTIRQLYV